jgi:hypothetical protein
VVFGESDAPEMKRQRREVVLERSGPMVKGRCFAFDKNGVCRRPNCRYDHTPLGNQAQFAQQQAPPRQQAPATCTLALVKEERALPGRDVFIDLTSVEDEPAEEVRVKEERALLATDVFVVLDSVKQEPARRFFVKEEEEVRRLRQDVALLQEFILREPAQREGSIVQRVGPTNTRGVVVEADESDPCKVHVLFDGEEEVENNLKVGVGVLLVELYFLV